MTPLLLQLFSAVTPPSPETPSPDTKRRIIQQLASNPNLNASQRKALQFVVESAAEGEKAKEDNARLAQDNTNLIATGASQAAALETAGENTKRALETGEKNADSFRMFAISFCKSNERSNARAEETDYETDLDEGVEESSSDEDGKPRAHSGPTSGQKRPPGSGRKHKPGSGKKRTPSSGKKRRASKLHIPSSTSCSCVSRCR